MKYNYHLSNVKYNYAKLALILYLFIALFFVIALIFSNSDKYYYYEYKKYEAKTEKKCEAVISDADNTTSSYNLGKISRNKMMNTLKDDSAELMYIYDNFVWNDGDAETKELYTVKREIILCYARLYDSRVKASLVGITYSETDQADYIKRLSDRYNEVEIDEKEKLNIN